MRRFTIASCILFLAIIFNYLPRSPEPALSRESLKNFPAGIGDWSLVNEHRMDESSMALLKVDDYIMRTYSNSKGETVSLYIGYFNTQREGKTNHSPRQCLPGAGWSIVEAAPVMLKVADHHPDQLQVNRYLMERGSDRELFLFWYQGRGRQIANEYLTKAYLTLDSVTKNRTDGALIRLNSAASLSPDSALRIQTDFIRSFYSILPEYIPN
jgi:EpsI family protein